MAQQKSFEQQLYDAANTLRIGANNPVPSLSKPTGQAESPSERQSKAAERRARREAAHSELAAQMRPAQIVAPTKPMPVAHVVPDMDLDALQAFKVELPKFDLPSVSINLGEMQADFFRRIAAANVALIRQAEAIRQQMRDYLNEAKELDRDAHIAETWGQKQRAQDLKNAAAKREAARNALKPHLTKVLDAFYASSALMSARIAMLDDSMAEYLAAQRQAKREAYARALQAAQEKAAAEEAERARRAAEKAAEAALAEKAAELAAAMAAPKDAEDDKYADYEPEETAPAKSELDQMIEEREHWAELITKAQMALTKGSDQRVEEAIASYQREYNDLDTKIQNYGKRTTKTQAKKARKSVKGA